jgi:acyl-CoA dehydrogenase
LKTIGAWAITEPDSGSDAFGAMRASARPEGDGWVLNGVKTFITNGPYADTVVFIAKIDDGRPWREREIATFVLDSGMPGLTQSRRLRKMGLHSSPTGEIVAVDVHVGPERRLLGSRPALGTGSVARARSNAKATFASERASVAAMAFGVIERCLELSVEYASTRTQFGRRIGDFQLIQAKLARMEIARLNVENLVLRHIAEANSGLRPSLAAASAMKLYSATAAASVANDAIQVFGGNGYMAEHPVEQLFRDARVLQIYGGTDEMQTTEIARNLLAPIAGDVRF